MDEPSDSRVRLEEVEARELDAMVGSFDAV
jgi:hypothetical protein